MAGPLSGLSVVDLTSTLTGAHITQTLADFGCDVVIIEPPGGHPLRTQPAWPFWARGKRSIRLDLDGPADRELARSLASHADVVVDTWRPGVADRLGLGYDDLSAHNPRLIHASVTGFGRDNPLSNIKAYEPIVMARIGALDAFGALADRPGPKYVASPYCAFSASQLALHGILAALIERESSRVGQRVETTLVQGVLAHDTWNWLLRMVASRFTDAFTAGPAISTPPSGGTGGTIVNSPLHLRLMVGFSRDGRYMQFSQMSDRLWTAFLRLTGIDALMNDPEWLKHVEPDDPMAMTNWLDKAIEITRRKTYDEWLEEFEREPDVWAEMFRDGSELLHHPQLINDERLVTIDDPVAGPVLQPGALVKMTATPAEVGTPAPVLDADGTAIRAGATPAPASEAVTPASPTAPPLDGITVVELGTYYAAPFGATVLADLGARVIKVEQLEGDPIRHIMPFPEVGGIKVLQGKESVAIDIASDEGREIVLELARRADVVLQSFRAGVAERHGYLADDLLAVNPELIYLNAPGYGPGRPYGQKPAFAPTIGAGSGLAYRNVGGRGNLPDDEDLPAEALRTYSTRLGAATMSVGQADGFSALGVGTALLLGLLAKRRGAPGQEMLTSMLSTMAHCLSEDMVEYDGRSPIVKPDHDLYGLGARYRLYEASDGWIFLAVPTDEEWNGLAALLDLPGDLKDDDDRLAKVLAERFVAKSKDEWERELLAADLACVAVRSAPVEEEVWFSGGLGETLGILTETRHPMFDTYPRLKPMVTMSRSRGVAGPAPLIGQQTDAVLAELGYSESQIGELRAGGVVG